MSVRNARVQKEERKTLRWASKLGGLPVLKLLVKNTENLKLKSLRFFETRKL